MSSIKQLFLSEVERETENTRKMMERLEGVDLTWKPHDKSASIGDLAGHIVEIHNWVGNAFVEDEFDFHTSYVPFKPVNAGELLDVLKSGQDRNTSFVNNQEDAAWDKMWTVRAGDFIIASMPKSAAFRFFLHNHLIHHRGQLSVYMRLLDIPVPGLYGPSADDKQQ